MTPANLLRAAEILEREATNLVMRSCVTWTEDHPEQREYDEMLAVAAELRKGAHTVASANSARAMAFYRSI